MKSFKAYINKRISLFQWNSGTWKLVPLFLLVTLLNISCLDSDPRGDLFTFSGEMMGEYFHNEERADVYSEFAKVLDTTQVIGLLNTYGEYTCFAPTNEAMKKYYARVGVDSYKDLSLDTLKTMVYNHVIKDHIIESARFYSWIFIGLKHVESIYFN